MSGIAAQEFWPDNALMLKNILRKENFAFGVLIGVFIGAVFVAVLEWPLSDYWRDYATFAIGVMVALLTSGLGIAGLLYRMEIERERSLLAARAMLPASLSELYSKSLLAAELSLEIEQIEKLSDEDRRAKFDQIKLDNQLVRDVQEVIKFSDDVTAGWLSLILARWQIRLSNLEDDLLDPKLENPIADPAIKKTRCARSAMAWIFVWGMVNHLFDYSRTGKCPERELPGVPSYQLLFRARNFAMQKELDRVQNNYVKKYSASGSLSVYALRDELKSPES